MSVFMDEFRRSVGSDVEGALGSELSLTPEQAAAAMDAVGPLVRGGLKRQVEQQGGEERLRHIMDKYSDASVVDDPRAYLGEAAQSGSGDPALGGLLGESGAEAAGMLDQRLGLSAGMGAKLIPMLAPLIRGLRAKKRSAASGAGSGGGDDGLSALTKILDRDGDGKILDDVGGLLTGQGGQLVAGMAKAGCLGMLLRGRK